MTKVDLTAPPRCAQVTENIAQLLAPTRLAGADIVPISTATGEGIDELRERLFDAARKFAPPASRGRFRLAVDRSFTLPGAGTVVTGTVLSGAVSVGDRLLVSPSGLVARVRSIHAQNRPAERGHAGDRCALNLAGEGITKDAIVRGDVVLDAELHAPTARIDAVLKVSASEPKPVEQWMPVHLHHAAAEMGARIVLLGEQPIAPGGEAFVQLVLDRPIAAVAGDHFVIRDTSAQRTIGGGRFLDLRPPARKRRSPERLAQLEALAIENRQASLAELLNRAPFYVDFSGFTRDHALSAEEAARMAEELGIILMPARDTALALSPASWTRMRDGLIAALEKFHKENPDLPGIGMERLRLQSEPRLPAPGFLSVLQALAQQQLVALDGAWVHLAGHEVRLAPQDEKTWENIRTLLSGAERFRPPRVRDIAVSLNMNEVDVRRLLKLIGRLGKVDEIAQDHFFLRETVGEMVDIILDIGGSDADQLTAAQFRDRLDNGRKVAIQILEFFDRHGVTIRRGDLRRINKHRLDLFRRTAVPAAGAAKSESGREASLVGRPDFKSGRGREAVLGGFDSHSLPPRKQGSR